MPDLRFSDHQRHIAAIRQAALRAADAARAVESNLRLTGDGLFVGSRRFALAPQGRLYLVALGKASPAMSRAAAQVLGERLYAGVAAVPQQGAGEPPAHVRFIPAGHPLPDEGSLAAGRAVADLLSQTRPEDLLLALVSGGGSAMLELPPPGVSLEDLRRLNSLLLRSGAPIQEINTVRRALSRIKAGGLAHLAAPARSAALILSDVVGNRISAVASGPTVLRAVPPGAARLVLERYDLWDQAPRPVRAFLSGHTRPITRAPRPYNLIVGSNRQVAEAAAQCAAQLGFPTRVLSYRMQGEAHEQGLRIARSLRRTARPACLLMGGETTVTVRGDGRGGRNQELALAAALALEGVRDVAVMSLATDGIDGPTDAAGALVTGESAARARARGLDPHAALQANDSYTLLDALDLLIRTGPTGTNLNDLVVGLAYP